MISANIRALILERIEFPNPEVLAKVEALSSAAATLAAAGEDYDDVIVEGDADADTVAAGILGLADSFAEVASPEKNQKVKDFFASVFTSSTPEKEQAGETLFNAALDFTLAANAINDLFTPAE